MAFRISNIYKSLLSQVNSTIDRVHAEGISPDLAYYAWDSRGDEAELENRDLVGLAGWSFDENGGLWEIHMGLTISTVNDENLMREIEIVDVFHDVFGEDCVVPLLDDAGTELSQLVIKHFEMLPAGQSEKRNYRPLGLTLRRTSNG